jgi:drug/metabolite transporter (DMT)-like permease
VALLRHRLEILGAALLFSTGGAAIKATTFTSWQVASFRSGIAALAVLLLVRGARRGWTWAVFPVGAAYAATMVLFVASNKLTTAANAIFLQASAPLYVLLLGPFLLREPLRRRDLGFMAVLVAGLVMFFVEPGARQATAANPPLGNMLAFLSGIFWALTIVGLRWISGRGDGEGSALPTVVVGNGLAFLVCLPMALPAQGSAVDWAAVTYLGLFQIAAAYVLLTTGIRHVPAVEASTLLLLEPALNPFWAWLVHGEHPGIWSLAGGALILGATIFKTWRDSRKITAPEAHPA